MRLCLEITGLEALKNQRLRSTLGVGKRSAEETQKKELGGLFFLRPKPRDTCTTA